MTVTEPAGVTAEITRIFCFSQPAGAVFGSAISLLAAVAGMKKAMANAKTGSDKDTVKVLVQVKSGDQTRFLALSLKKA
jgi:hypothetical protein